MTALPKKALSRPPSEPGGGVIWVKSEGLIAARPFISVVHRIHASQNKPKPVAASDRTSATAFLIWRRRYRCSAITLISVPLFPVQPHQHPLRDREHDEGH